MGKKGQISLEFMLLIVFLLVYLSGTLLPAIDLAATTAQEVEGIGQSRIAAQKIVSTVNRLQNQNAGAKETVTIFVPADATITCNTSDKKIGFSFHLTGSPVTRCDNDEDNPPDSTYCTVSFPTQLPSQSSDFCGTSSGFPVLGGQSARITITKTSSGTTVNVA